MSERRHNLVAPLAGAVLWTFVLLGRLWSVDESWWIARDDAVITLSHAKNLAKFGTIGVSPGGDRVEGYSSPLHLLAAYLVQLPADLDYRTIDIVLLAVSVAATGALATIALRSLSVDLGFGGGRSVLQAVALSSAVAVTVAAPWTSVGWMGSGMENPLVVLAGIAVATSAMTLQGRRAAQILLVATVSLFSIARVELAALTVPLIITVAWLHASRVPADRRRTVFVQTTAAPLLIVAVVHLGRRLYFGQWLPNTAIVQSRQTGLEQLAFIALVGVLLLALLASSVLRSRQPDATGGAIAAAVTSTISVVSAAGLLWMAATGRTAGSVIELLLLPPLIPLAVVVLVLLRAVRAFDATPHIVDNVFAALVAVPLCQYIVMGPARLDQYRVAVVAVPFLALWAATLALRLGAAMRVAPWPAAHTGRLARRWTAGLLIVTVLLGLSWIAADDGARRLQYEITGAPQIIDVVNAVRDEHLAGTGLAIVANPDLGKVSFDKGAVMVDLGLLGDPLLTRIHEDRPDLLATYLELVAGPDVVESHSGWSCEYGAWLDSPAFSARYALSDDRWLDQRAQAPDCPFAGRWSIWVRTDAAEEYALTRRLLGSDHPDDVARRAIESCARRDGDAFRCQGVRRAAQRAAVTLRAGGATQAVVAALEGSPTATLDAALLLRRPGWADDAFEAFVRLADGTD